MSRDFTEQGGCLQSAAKLLAVRFSDINQLYLYWPYFDDVAFGMPLPFVMHSPMNMSIQNVCIDAGRVTAGFGIGEGWPPGELPRFLLPSSLWCESGWAMCFGGVTLELRQRGYSKSVAVWFKRSCSPFANCLDPACSFMVLFVA